MALTSPAQEAKSWRERLEEQTLPDWCQESLRELYVSMQEQADLTDGVMEALSKRDVVIADAFRESVAAHPVPDLWADVSEELIAAEERLQQLWALNDGELERSKRLALTHQMAARPSLMKEFTQQVQLSSQVQAGLQPVAEELRALEGLWEELAQTLNIRADEVPGWEETAQLLRDEWAETTRLGRAEGQVLQDDVMTALLPVKRDDLLEPEEPSQRVNRAWGALALAMVAVWLISLVTLTQSPQEPDLASSTEPLAEVQEAATLAQLSPSEPAAQQVEVEELIVAEGALIQMLQFEEDGPVFFMIEDEETDF